MSKNIRYRMCREIESQIRLGTSKKSAEIKAGGKSPYIHSAATARTYMQQARQYGDWLRERGYNHASLEQAKELAHEYILSQESIFSKHTARSALARVFGCDGKELCELEPRRPQDITRGRTGTKRTNAIEQNHPEIAEICRSLGARHHKELVRLTAADFYEDENGHLFAKITGKGGRRRAALVLPGLGEHLIRNRIAATSEGPLFPDVPDHSNVHRWRADYAARAYEYALAHGMGTGKLYCCRDKSGRKYDKGALDWVSAQLGHGAGRYYTVIYNYLSYGDVGNNGTESKT